MKTTTIVSRLMLFVAVLMLSGCFLPYWGDEDGGNRGGGHHDGGGHREGGEHRDGGDRH